MTADEELRFTRNVLLTGFWPPTNEMLRAFSTNPDLNPDGWQGENWRGLGFDIHSYFPEFPDQPHPLVVPRAGSAPWGEGDFRVDYQSTLSDWNRLTLELRPVCIITFSYDARSDVVWKIEGFAENRATWQPDGEEPLQPDPSPPDSSIDASARRYTSLPVNEILASCRRLDSPRHGPRPNTYVETTESPGGYVSEYIAYLGMWYRDSHVDCSHGARCVSAGHIHVNTGSEYDPEIRRVLEDVDTARRWMEATLEATVIDLPLRLVNCLGIRTISRLCLGDSGPISVRRDIIGESASGPHSCRSALAELLRKGPV